MTVAKKEISDDEKCIFFDAMCYILNIDRKPNEKKVCYLKNKAFEMRFDARKLKLKSTKKAAEIVKDLQAIDNIRLRRYILREMILLAIADHELTDKEVDTIYDIAKKVCISQDKIDDFFIWAAKGVEWQIEGQKLVEEDL